MVLLLSSYAFTFIGIELLLGRAMAVNFSPYRDDLDGFEYLRVWRFRTQDGTKKMLTRYHVIDDVIDNGKTAINPLIFKIICKI